MCQTNPIARSGAPRRCREVGRPTEYPAFRYSIIPPFQSNADDAKQTQFREVNGRTQEPAVQTNPICGGAGWDKATGTNVRNKANPGYAGWGEV
jgi:hypothetical protein